MPLALDPNETYAVVLECDQEKPAETQPRFLFRYMSMRQWRDFAKFGEDRQALEKLPFETVLDQLLTQIKLHMAGWENMGRDYEPDELDAVITLTEAWELYYAARRQSRIGAEDKKKYESGLAKVSERSVPAACQENVTTGQA